MRICLAGSYDPDFGRNRKIHEALTGLGASVSECRVEIWTGDRVELAQNGRVSAAIRALVAYPRLLWRLLASDPPDVFLVAHPGWFDVPVVWLAARRHGVPILYDMFISLYDTMVLDRGLVAPHTALAKICKAADRLACRLASRVTVDTPADRKFFSELTGQSLDRFGVVWLGAQDQIFRPRPGIEVDCNTVVFHGTFVPLQGVDIVVRAAKLLEPEGIRFEIVGDGQQKQMIDRLVDSLGIANVTMHGMVPMQALPDYIGRATVCLGIFGTTDKANRVIPHKLFECLAMRRPVITRASSAVASAFTEEEVVTCEPGNPESLAAAILTLMQHPDRRERIAEAGHRRYLRDYSRDALVDLWRREVTRTISTTR